MSDPLGFVECPHCDTAQVPELVGRRQYLYPCCGKTFEVPPPTSTVSGQRRQRGALYRDER